MKKRELVELRIQSMENLSKKVIEMRKKMLETRVKIVVGKEKNLRLAKNMRKDIAQVETLISEKRKEEKK